MRLTHKSSFIAICLMLLAVSTYVESTTSDKVVYKPEVYSNLNTTLMGGLDLATLRRLGLKVPQHNGLKALVYLHSATETLVTFVKLENNEIALMMLSNMKASISLPLSRKYATLKDLFVSFFPNQAVPDFVINNTQADHPVNLSPDLFSTPNCNIEVDQAEFNALWQGKGWSRQHYIVINPSVVGLTDTPSEVTNTLSTHYCRYNPEIVVSPDPNPAVHIIWILFPDELTRRGGPYIATPMVGQLVGKNQRSYIRLINGYWWRYRASGKVQAPSPIESHQLGIMAP